MNIARTLQEAASNAVEWNINKLKFNGGTLNAINVATVRDLKFNSDGTKAYFLRLSNIYEYSLSVAYDLSTKSNLVIHDLDNPSSNYSFFFKPDGTRMYVCLSNTDIYEYSLSTAWDLTTLTLVSTTTGTNYLYIFFKSDGTKLFLSRASETVEYSLSTAWDISTKSLVATKSHTNNSSGIYFSSDGLKMFLADTETIDIYTLSTAWSLSTASYSSTYTAPGQLARTSTSITFNNDGTIAFIGGYFVGFVLGFNLSTAWDFSTASPAYPSSDFLSLDDGSGISSVTSLSAGVDTGNVFFKPDGTELYFFIGFYSRVFQYTLSTPWDISSATFTTFVELTGRDIRHLFIKPDGSSLFIIDYNGFIYQYNLATYWNVYTAVFSKLIKLDGFGWTLFFKPDGTKLYYNSSSNIYEYSLSTPWDIYSAGTATIKNIGNNTESLYFRNDGGAFYICANDTSAGVTTLKEFELDTPWNVSTAIEETGVVVDTFVGSANVKGLFFRDTGKKAYITFQDFNYLLSYDL